MPHINIEIKARCADQEPLRAVLKQHDADFHGLDHQVDTYFKVEEGRLKLREGTIERALIRYRRLDHEGPKQSDVTLFHPPDDPALKVILADVLGVLVVVDKQREIYFVDNVKIHLDRLESLGTFVEIEAIDKDGSLGAEHLHTQCREWMERFEIRDEDLVDWSYSDLLMDLLGLKHS